MSADATSQPNAVAAVTAVEQAVETAAAAKGVNLSGKTWAGIGGGLGSILIAAATWANSMQQGQANTAAELSAMRSLLQDMKADLGRRLDRVEGRMDRIEDKQTAKSGGGGE